MEDDVKTLGDYVSIVWRRKFHILIPFILVLAVTIPTVFLLPSVFKSTGTILIESQQIPEQLVQSAVTSFAKERIQVIKQRIMTSQQLFAIITKFELYQDKIKNTPRSEILDNMRGRISIDPLSADLKTSRQKRTSALIAFTISFEHTSAVTAQKVASELVTLFLDENIRSRTARAEETSGFMKKESARLGNEITLLEEQIASFKQENAGSLPEALTLKLQLVSNLRTAHLTSAGNLNSLNERRKLLLIDIDTLKQREETHPQDGLSEEQRLKKQELAALQKQYISLSARYGSGHPDVKAVERQIDAFQKEYGNLADMKDLQAQKNQAEVELQDLTHKYSSEHPDVKKMKRQLEGIVFMIAELDEPVDDAPVDDRPNPLMLQATAKLESVDNSIARISDTRQDIEAQIEVLEAQINRIPKVEQGLDALERDYDNIRHKYQEIKSKQLQAELSQSLEENQKGERFTLLEPPQRPDKPVKPDRPKLFMVGFLLSMMGGLGVAGVAEFMDGGIRGSRALAAVTQMTPLVTIPYISVAKDVVDRKRWVKILLISIVLLGIAAVCAVHFFYKPLDLLWFIVLRNLNLA